MTYVTLLRQDARDLNYWVLRKLDNDCYSESSKLQFERIHKALLTGIHGAEKMPEQFKLSKEHIEAIEKMINNVISTVEGSDDIELKIIDNEEWEAVLYVGIDSAYRKFGDIEYNDP